MLRSTKLGILRICRENVMKMIKEITTTKILQLVLPNPGSAI